MDPDKLSKEELVSQLSRRGEDTRGRKPVLLERLREILKEEQFQGEQAISQAAEKCQLSKEHEEREPEKTEEDRHIQTQSRAVSGGDDAASVRPASSIRSMSSIASARAMERARLAGLSAKKQALKKKHLIEAQEVELRRMREEIELQAEIEECEAREKAYEEMLTEAPQAHTVALQPQEQAARPQEAVLHTRVGAGPQDAVPHQQESKPNAVSLSQAVATKPQVTMQPGLREVASLSQEKKPNAVLLQSGPLFQEVTERTNKPHEVAERPQVTAPLLQEVTAGPQESASPQQSAESLRHDIKHG